MAGIGLLRTLGNQAADVAAFALEALWPAADRSIAAHYAFARWAEPITPPTRSDAGDPPAAPGQPTDAGAPPVGVGGHFIGIAAHPELVELEAHLTEILGGHAPAWLHSTLPACVCTCGQRFVDRDEHAGHVAEIQTNAVALAYEAAAFTASAADWQ